MDRVKDITKLKLGSDKLILKIVEKKSAILMPEGHKGDATSYATVIHVGTDVSDLKVGDIALVFESNSVFTWKEEKYAIVSRYQIAVAIEADNFLAHKTLD